MSLTFETLRNAQVADALEHLARLRAEVFRDWPYLYDGDPETEAAYLRSYKETEGAILIAAKDGARIVGCATGMPLASHEDASDVPLGSLGLDIDQVFYCAESVLLPAYRGMGAGHAFFDRREEHAREMGFEVSMFCAVERPEDHPLKPDDARSLAPFWAGRDYEARDAHVAMTWRDIDEDEPREKRLRVWTKKL